MRYAIVMAGALAFSGGVEAQDAVAWIASQGLEAVEVKPFQDLEVVIAKAPGSKELRFAVLAKGKPVYQSTPKENELAAKLVVHSMGNDLDGDGQPDLHYSTYSGGAHCCTTHYVIKLKPKVSKLASYAANNVGGGDFLEVPGRKTPIMITADDSSAYGFAPYANSYFPAVILEVSPKGRFQFAADLMRSKLPAQPPPVCGQPAATNNPWLKERCGEYVSSRRNSRTAEIKAKLSEIKQGRSADQLKWDDYYASGVLAAVSAELNRYAYTGHSAAGMNWLETMWPGNDAVKLKMISTLRQSWGKSVFAEDLKVLASDYR
ncbi:hypothetical protein BWI17_21090 [Betaproteobacteria bacterium GR16-43]|nr:hypothetical protein BWI17_21090 [Betaproteobacteria bacterium GR16-43]